MDVVLEDAERRRLDVRFLIYAFLVAPGQFGACWKLRVRFSAFQGSERGDQAARHLALALRVFEDIVAKVRAYRTEHKSIRALDIFDMPSSYMSKAVIILSEYTILLF